MAVEMLETVVFEDIRMDLYKHLETKQQRTFASDAGISQRTLKRFLQRKSVCEKTLIAIFTGLYGNNKIVMLEKLIQKYPNIPHYKNLMNYYNQLKIKDEFDMSRCGTWFHTDLNFKLMCLLAHENGATEKLIEKHFGLAGLSVLKDLVRENAVEQLPSKATTSDGLLRFSLDRNVEEDPEVKKFRARQRRVMPRTRDGEMEKRFRAIQYRFHMGKGLILKNFLRKTIDNYDPETFRTKDSHISHMFGTLSPYGFSLAKELILKFAQDFDKIEIEHPGHIPFSAGAVMIKILPKDELSVY